MARLVGLAAIVFLSISSAAAQDEPKVQSSLGQPRIYWGQSVNYVIRVSGATSSAEPELKGLDDFDVVSLGSESSASSRIVNINGQMRQTVSRSTLIQYRLTPSKTGKLTIPAPVVKVDGQVLVGQEHVLEVLAPEEQDIVFMEITSDRSAVFPMQPFTVTLSVVVKGLPGRYSDQNPMAVRFERVGAPGLSVPWAPQGSKDKLPAGLTPLKSPGEWNQQTRSESGAGFAINNMIEDALFSLFRSRALLFQSDPRRISRKDKNGQAALYWQYDFPRGFVPEKPGEYKFGPAKLEGAFGTGLREGGALMGEEIYAVAAPVVVAVKDVPTAGRPESYIGLIGTFQARAELEPKECKVGDPMTLSIELTGTGTFANAITPDLKRVPEIIDHFKVYEATEEIKKTRCRFTYGLRPQAAGIQRFPPVALSYFDVEAERYVTLDTEPIPIQIIQTDHLSYDQIVSAGDPAASSVRSELEARREGIFANITDPGAVRNERVRPRRWLLSLAGMAGLYACVLLLTARLQRIAGDSSIVRRRGAAAKAKQRLAEGLSDIGGGRFTQGADLVRSAVVGLVADVTDSPEAGMTPRDVDSRLGELGVDDELRGRVTELLDTCDAARYGVTDRSEELGHEAAAVLDEIISAMKAGRRFR